MTEVFFLWRVMKSRLLFSFVITALLVASMYQNYKTNLVEMVAKPNATVYIYCKNYNGLNLSNGVGYVKTDCSRFKGCLQNARGVDGVTVVMDKSGVDVVALVKKLGLNQTFSQQTQDFTCIYGYTDKISDCVVVDGQKVNVQIAVTPTQVHVGSPLLLGSY